MASERAQEFEQANALELFTSGGEINHLRGARTPHGDLSAARANPRREPKPATVVGAVSEDHGSFQTAQFR